jgi:arylsulfatase A-like enzyme
VIFWGAPFRAVRATTTARVVDIAPTLAQALGLVPSEKVDGRVLGHAMHEHLRGRAPRPRD